MKDYMDIIHLVLSGSSIFALSFYAGRDFMDGNFKSGFVLLALTEILFHVSTKVML